MDYLICKNGHVLTPDNDYGEHKKYISSRCKKCNYETVMRHARTENRCKYRYGLSYEEYQTFWLIQGGTCGICLEILEEARFGVDHDHATGKVRGLLCTNCNSALGMMKDSIENLQRAVEYLSDI